MSREGFVMSREGVLMSTVTRRDQEAFAFGAFSSSTR